MAWITIIEEDEATGRLKELYDKYFDDSFGGARAYGCGDGSGDDFCDE